MNIAVLIAGGIGARTGLETPKQFVQIDDKPIIVYTLEAFERHLEIDGICVVCLSGWENNVWKYKTQYNITKLLKVVTGGTTGFESIKIGLHSLKDILKDNDDIVIIHDAVRPFISQDIITDNLEICRKNGNAIATIPSVEALLRQDPSKENCSEKSEDRSMIFRAQTPQAVKYLDFLQLHKKAEERGITDSVATATLLTELDETAYFSKGSEENIKITTIQDIELFRALLFRKNNILRDYQKICVEGNQRLVEYGLVILTWGNYSLRIPGTDLVCIKPSGVPYSRLQPELIPIVNLDGQVIEGNLKPSVDLLIHLEIYKSNPNITNIVHTHSTYATLFSQKLQEIPVLGTTHADFCNLPIPVARPLTEEEIVKDYEKFSGITIGEQIIKRGLDNTPAVLLPYHAPFIFGTKTLDSCDNALILEEIAKIAYFNLSSESEKIPETLVNKLWTRKHGKNAYYGQFGCEY